MNDFGVKIDSGGIKITTSNATRIEVTDTGAMGFNGVKPVALQAAPALVTKNGEVIDTLNSVITSLKKLGLLK